MSLTVTATKKRAELTAAVVLTLAGLAVVVLWLPISHVGKTGAVTVPVTADCANPGDISFDGSTWTPEAGTPFMPESWTSDRPGRFTIRTPHTGEFVSDGEHYRITYVRLPKGTFSMLNCSIR